MPITRTTLKRFTAFEDLDISFSPGINVLVGENGTGKTHLMKVCYAALVAWNTGEDYLYKLINVFMPTDNEYPRLVKRNLAPRYAEGAVEIFGMFDGQQMSLSIQNVSGSPEDGFSSEWPRNHATQPIRTAYIPVKDMLANAPGFRSLYSLRELHFEEIYFDVLNAAYIPPLRQQPDAVRENLLTEIAKIMGGEVVIKNEEFFLDSQSEGMLEFPLVAEGLRKLGLIWLLIQNGTLGDGSVLFWDEPETNLNPKLYKPVIETLLTLQRNGVQIFLATHDYVILKELDLQMTQDDNIAFHSLFRSRETGEIECRSTESYLDISPNAISDTFSELYDRSIERSLGKGPVGR